jgi:hypothetical protein
MKRVYIFACLLACVSMGNVFAAVAPKVVNPKDQTDVYGIPTDTDEVEDEQEIDSLEKK